MSVVLYVLFLFVFKWHQSFHVVGNSHSKKKSPSRRGSVPGKCTKYKLKWTMSHSLIVNWGWHARHSFQLFLVFLFKIHSWLPPPPTHTLDKGTGAGMAPTSELSGWKWTWSPGSLHWDRQWGSCSNSSPSLQGKTAHTEPRATEVTVAGDEVWAPQRGKSLLLGIVILPGLPKVRLHVPSS